MPESAPANPEDLFSILDENVEWDYVGAFPEIQTAHGLAEVREFLREWSEAFDDFSFQAEEMVDAGDSVVVRVRQWGRGKETGAQVENQAWQVFTLRNGKVLHCRGMTPSRRPSKRLGCRSSAFDEKRRCLRITPLCGAGAS